MNLHLARPSTAYSAALSWFLLGWLVSSTVTAQTTSAWVSTFPTTTWPSRFTEDVLPLAGGGAVMSWVGASSSVGTATGESIVRRLSENGDLVWEISFPLLPDDYILYPFREYRADTAVGKSGEVAVAIGSSGPMKIHLYEADGSLRWEASVDTVVGPHFERANLEVAPDGDVLLSVSEGLFANGDPRYFGLYRWEAATGTLLWSQTGPTQEYVFMELDDAGNVYLAIDRGPAGDWGLERYSPAGLATGSVVLPGSAYRVQMAMDGSGRSVIAWFDPSANAFLSSIDTALNLEWTVPLPVTPKGVTLMSDGDSILLPESFSGPMRRYDRQGGLRTSVVPANSFGHIYGHVIGRANGHSIAASAKYPAPMTPYLMNVEERDAQGTLVRSFERSMPDEPYFYAHAMALDSRENVVLVYDARTATQIGISTAEKVLFASSQGVAYCGSAVPNSTGRPATTAAVGSSRTGVNNLSLVFEELPPGSFVLPLASRTTGLTAQAGGGQGTLCLGGSIGRFDEPGEIRSANAMGHASVQLELQSFPTPTGFVPVMVGETWSFQGWYRDANPGLTSNFTDAVTVAFF
ncbi:hypothetical protein Poly30_29390 [Planctomycetes bacterium Poly30]|uniref:PQQ enzyme repeat protein n=1 Tax=Saltatorellus ferox TaxID=2528018 RepID=A0A518ETL3_9BACT|nr:hypothetical protein Poly30_29390 [Planctomycetes bacterium Poly30]